MRFYGSTRADDGTQAGSSFPASFGTPPISLSPGDKMCCALNRPDPFSHGTSFPLQLRPAGHGGKMVKRILRKWGQKCRLHSCASLRLKWGGGRREEREVLSISHPPTHTPVLSRDFNGKTEKIICVSCYNILARAAFSLWRTGFTAQRESGGNLLKGRWHHKGPGTVWKLGTTQMLPSDTLTKSLGASFSLWRLLHLNGNTSN